MHWTHCVVGVWRSSSGTVALVQTRSQPDNRLTQYTSTSSQNRATMKHN